MYEITKTVKIDAGHRVVGHQGKCAHLHGHSYEFDVVLRADELQDPGFVMDYGRISEFIKLWDHRMLLWDEDPLLTTWETPHWEWGIVELAFNPTAENMAEHLCETFFQADGIIFTEVTVHETESSSATVTKEL